MFRDNEEKPSGLVGQRGRQRNPMESVLGDGRFGKVSSRVMLTSSRITVAL